MEEEGDEEEQDKIVDQVSYTHFCNLMNIFNKNIYVFTLTASLESYV